MKIALLSSKGQITIPKEMQKLLQISHRSKLAIYPKDDALIIKPIKTSIVNQVAGSLSHLIPPEKRGASWKQVMKETQKIVAAKLAKNR